MSFWPSMTSKLSTSLPNNCLYCIIIIWSLLRTRSALASGQWDDGFTPSCSIRCKVAGAHTHRWRKPRWIQMAYHPQPTCLSAEAQAFLSKVKMPILIYGSSAHLFSTFCSTRYGVCCKLALSFTFCKTLFIQSM